jgi:GMP synthase-like glutamine amidotransferase
MVLIVNCIIDAKERAGFDRSIVPKLAEIAGRPAEVVSLEQLEGRSPGADCDHVLISGSELSAAQPLDTDEPLLGFIRRTVDAPLPLLGICYGHQMIARALLGDTACRRAAVPEFGFKRLELANNPLFAGIDTLVPVHSHYDEVTGLPADRFEVIASTDDCEVQAFQLRGHAVWGVQFHPELDERSGRKMLQRNCETEAAARERFVDELTDSAHVEAGRRLFENFFRVPRP